MKPVTHTGPIKQHQRLWSSWQMKYMYQNAHKKVLLAMSLSRGSIYRGPIWQVYVAVGQPHKIVELDSTVIFQAQVLKTM